MEEQIVTFHPTKSKGDSHNIKQEDKQIQGYLLEIVSEYIAQQKDTFP